MNVAISRESLLRVRYTPMADALSNLSAGLTLLQGAWSIEYLGSRLRDIECKL